MFLISLLIRANGANTDLQSRCVLILQLECESRQLLRQVNSALATQEAEELPVQALQSQPICGVRI